MSGAFEIYRRWLRDRRRSTIVWSVSIAAVSVVTAAFFSSLGQSLGENAESGSTTSSMLGLSDGIDPQTPTGFLWAANYSNQLPWLMMALAIALGTAAIAGDEADGTLEYVLSKPVTRSAIAMARAAGMVTILFISAIVNLVAVAITAPLFDLYDSVTITGADGSTSTASGLTFGQLVVGGLAAFAVALGSGAIAYLLGAASGRKGWAMGGASGFAVAGYVLYTLSNVTGDLEFLTWISPWRWFIDDAMMVNGLTWDILWPFALTVVAVVAGWQLFLRRDLQN
ncbi:ABC transporter permease [Ilumatobacter nonamiensis]|uniref:ABC transporter permease n=1 Tax=Ilumatobacter nonamiensis TaxID=467093 RepID=UPI00034AF502|nr:ABC transporter permease [Ilumatobacter nonamiensis]